MKSTEKMCLYLPVAPLTNLHLCQLPVSFFLQFSLLNSSPFFVLFFCPWLWRDKFVEIDLKPVCKHCYEKMPDEFKRRLAKREREAKEKEKQKKKKPICLWTLLLLTTTCAPFFFGQFCRCSYLKLLHAFMAVTAKYFSQNCNSKYCYFIIWSSACLAIQLSWIDFLRDTVIKRDTTHSEYFSHGLQRI